MLLSSSVILAIVLLATPSNPAIYTAWEFDDNSSYVEDCRSCLKLVPLSEGPKSEYCSKGYFRLYFKESADRESLNRAIDSYHNCMFSRGYRIKQQIIGINNQELKEFIRTSNTCGRHKGRTEMDRCLAASRWYLVTSKPWFLETATMKDISGRLSAK
mgnify:CR=1 FL=1